MYPPRKLGGWSSHWGTEVNGESFCCEKPKTKKIVVHISEKVAGWPSKAPLWSMLVKKERGKGISSGHLMGMTGNRESMNPWREGRQIPWMLDLNQYFFSNWKKKSEWYICGLVPLSFKCSMELIEPRMLWILKFSSKAKLVCSLYGNLELSKKLKKKEREKMNNGKMLFLAHSQLGYSVYNTLRCCK